jgi:hypothetical protein
MKYGQARLDLADQLDLVRDRARYESDRAREVQLNATHGIDEVMKAQQLDALPFPGSSGSGVAARPGYPTVIVPFATVPNAPADLFPSGFDARPAPLGVSCTGSACSEPRLLALAYAFEKCARSWRNLARLITLFDGCSPEGLLETKSANFLGNGAPAATRTRDPQLRRVRSCFDSFRRVHASRPSST